MKKILVILAIAFVLVGVSCSNEQYNQHPSIPPYMLGNWESSEGVKLKVAPRSVKTTFENLDTIYSLRDEPLRIVEEMRVPEGEGIAYHLVTTYKDGQVLRFSAWYEPSTQTLVFNDNIYMKEPL